jgi:glycosyltransferase involved in cell wall biosynthesis
MRRFAHLLAMGVEAIATYGTAFSRYHRRTAAANRAYAQANDIVLREYPQIDAVIQIGVNHAPYLREKRPGILYTAFTDHTNLLSKKLPDYGLHIPQRSVKPFWNDIERKNLLLLDHVFVMGSHVKQSMVDDYQVPADRISVVGGGPNVDVDIDRDKVQKNYRLKNVLFVGLDAERKGLPALKRAFREVRKTHADATLHIVGVSGTDEPNIVHHGKLRGSALQKLFYEAQIFAMPSLREPFGIAFLEAMWSRAVCIGTNVEAMPEIIQNGVTGYTIEPNDVSAIASAINQLFNNPEQLKTYADNAYSAAKLRWSWDVVVAKIQAQIERLSSR